MLKITSDFRIYQINHLSSDFTLTDRIRQGCTQDVCLQISEELHKNIYMPEQRVKKEEMKKNRWLWKEPVSVQTCFSLKCTIIIKVFLQMLMLKTSLFRDQTLIFH